MNIFLHPDAFGGNAAPLALPQSIGGIKTMNAKSSAALFAGDGGGGKPLNNLLINFHSSTHENILKQLQHRRQTHRNVPLAGRIH